MSTNTPDESRPAVSRREFVKTTAIAGAASMIAPSIAFAQNDRPLRVGLIGCGGRGTGAAHNALEASEQTQIVALADLFQDHLNNSRNSLVKKGPRGTIEDDACYVGFDAYQQLLNRGDIDIAILATPPHFRPIHFAAAVDAGCNVFMEKPVAVDPTGIRLVIAKAEEARAKKLSICAGTQRRHQASYQALIQKVHDGAIGDIRAARCYWNMGELWMKQPKPEWSEMEWQIRNWLYFTWLSGDHICEQHVHNIDVVNWALGALPVKAVGLGGREVRTHEHYGNIYDHHCIDFEYPNGVHVMSMCRQTGGCVNNVSEAIVGATGEATTQGGRSVIMGENKWRFTGDNPNPYVQEHKDLVDSITGKAKYWNEGKQVAESTLCAIMGRMSCYTGQEVSWDQAINSKLDLSPKAYAFGDQPVRPVAVPGKTPLI